MQHCKIIKQEAQRVKQYAESDFILHWQTMNIFYPRLQRLVILSPTFYIDSLSNLTLIPNHSPKPNPQP